MWCRLVPCRSSFIPNFKPRSKCTENGSIRLSRSFPVILSATRQIPAPCNSICCAWTTLPGCYPRDGQFVPLAKEEVQLIGSFTHAGDRVVPMSEALKDGDRVVVTAGPLLGHEGLIKTINRRKSTAYLELDLCGRRVTTRVGLAVLSAEQRTMRNLKKGDRLTTGDCLTGQGGSPRSGR